jgi:hypothetical protein
MSETEKQPRKPLEISEILSSDELPSRPNGRVRSFPFAQTEVGSGFLVSGSSLLTVKKKANEAEGSFAVWEDRSSGRIVVERVA